MLALHEAVVAGVLRGGHRGVPGVIILIIIMMIIIIIIIISSFSLIIKIRTFIL